MKNFSKNNSSKKNNNLNKRRSQSKNSLWSKNFDDKNNSRKNNYRQERKNLNKPELNINDLRHINSKVKDKNKFSPSQERISSNKPNFEDWIWGKHSVYAALVNARPINRIWCTADIFSSEKFYLLLKDLKSKGVLIEEVSWSRLSQLTYGAVHQGVALQLASSKTISLNKLIEFSKTKSSNPIIVAMDGITDPQNLGAIIRSAEAFDCNGIIIPQRRSAGLTGTVAKVAAGALEHIPVSRVINLNRALDELKKNGFVIIGLSGDGQVPISKFKEKVPLIVIVGAENKGISLITQKNCDFLVKIPLRGKTSSLNASVAAAIALHHLSNR